MSNIYHTRRRRLPNRRVPGAVSTDTSSDVMLRPLLFCLAFCLAATMQLRAADAAPLGVESGIPLGQIPGRIDHLAADLKRHRLDVAELGNDSIGVIDLDASRVIRTLRGLKEPQGIGYEPRSDTVYVANARDGSVDFFKGEDLSPLGSVDLGADADNVRIDEAAHRVWVGYGKGALAIIDPNSHRKIADVPLRAHPESFRLASTGPQIYVNVPEAGEIAVVDRVATSSGARTSLFVPEFDRLYLAVRTSSSNPAAIWVLRPEP